MEEKRDEVRPNDDDGRQPYEPPAIEESIEFETLALGCANPDPHTGQFS